MSMIVLLLDTAIAILATVLVLGLCWNTAMRRVEKKCDSDE